MITFINFNLEKHCSTETVTARIANTVLKRIIRFGNETRFTNEVQTLWFSI